MSGKSRSRNIFRGMESALIPELLTSLILQVEVKSPIPRAYIGRLMRAGTTVDCSVNQWSDLHSMLDEQQREKHRGED